MTKVEAILKNISSKVADYTISLGIFIVSSLLLPGFIVFSLFKPKLRKTLLPRIGLSKTFSTLKEKNCSRIWIHAASVGEVSGIEPLIKRIQLENSKLLEQQKNSIEIIFTTTSFTAREYLQKKGYSKFVEILVFDHPLLVARFIKQISPDLVIIAETELWPALLSSLRKFGIKTVLVNARISDFTFHNYLKFRFIFGRLLRTFDLIIAQTKLDYDRFMAVGEFSEPTRNYSKTRLIVGGSTKYSNISAAFDKNTVEYEKQRQLFFENVGFTQSRFTLIAGSIREAEEGIFFEILNKFLTCPDFQLILAPRHPERFTPLKVRLEREGIPFHLRSKGGSNTGQNLLLLDTIGELKDIYGMADLAIVGGSFEDVGGHNPLEPAAWGVGTVMGSNYNNVKEIVEQLISVNGIVIVSSYTELDSYLKNLFLDFDNARLVSSELGKRAKQVADKYQDVCETVFQEIKYFLPSKF